MKTRFHRRTEIVRLRAELERNGFPRLKMLLIVGLTGGAGLVASYCLLRWGGVDSMALRYPLALCIAYVVFLFLLWLWLRTDAEDYGDIPDVSWLPSPKGRGCGQGTTPRPQADDAAGESGVLDAVTAADEFAIPIVVLAAIVAVAASSLWVVYSAPMLFAELLVDGVLAASLYHRLRGLETQHWLQTAIQKTALPFGATAIALVVCGLALQHYVPEAKSLGDVIRHLKVER